MNGHGEKLVLCRPAVKWWDEELEMVVKEEIYINGDHLSAKATSRWVEYTPERNKL